MLRRAVLVAVSAVALVPFLGGTASASCLDDAQAGLTEGNYFDPKSEHWWDLSYVEVTGTANVELHGDALVSDTTTYAGDWVRNSQNVAGNVPGVTTGFVNCVAG